MQIEGIGPRLEHILKGNSMGGLVLSRRLNEVILIGHTIKIEVIEIRGNYVRLHVTAPKDITVHRKEIADAIAREEQDRET